LHHFHRSLSGAGVCLNEAGRIPAAGEVGERNSRRRSVDTRFKQLSSGEFPQCKTSSRCGQNNSPPIELFEQNASLSCPTSRHLPPTATLSRVATDSRHQDEHSGKPLFHDAPGVCPCGRASPAFSTPRPPFAAPGESRER